MLKPFQLLTFTPSLYAYILGNNNTESVEGRTRALRDDAEYQLHPELGQPPRIQTRTN